MSKYALNLKNILSWYDTELTKAKKRIWKMKDLLDYEKSISDQKQNEINLKYREVIALQEHIEELEKENAELKEQIALMQDAECSSCTMLGDMQIKIDNLEKENAELKEACRKWFNHLKDREKDLLVEIQNRDVKIAELQGE
jgi:FtsZ-binding cell division protein ZapB